MATETFHILNDQDDNHGGDKGEEDNIMIQTQDPHAMGTNTSEQVAFMNVVKANLGTGMLSMPIVFSYTGLWLGLLLIFFCGFIATYCMRLLLEVSSTVAAANDLDISKMDYTETVFNVFKFGPEILRKPKGKMKFLHTIEHIVNGFLIVTQIGFCCVYILFVSQNLQGIIEYWMPSATQNIYLIGFIVSLFLMPFSLITNMNSLSLANTAANLSTVIGLVLLFIYCVASGMQDWHELQQPMGVKQFLIGFGIILFAFEGISLVLPIRNKMRNPENANLPDGALNAGMVIVVLLSASLGFFGFMRFGKDTKPSITYNIGETPVWIAPIKPLFIFSILVSYVLQFYVPAAIFTRLAEKIRWHREGTERQRTIFLKISRLSMVMIIYGMSMVIPHLDLLLSLIGALCSSMLAIIIPPILMLVHKWPHRHLIHDFNLRYVLPLSGIICFGLISFVGGTIATILQLIEVYQTGHEMN